MHENTYIPFTKAMKRDYTILVPNMLPMHFKLIAQVARTYGYRMKLLETSGPQIVETGLRYTHNDACYPAVCVIGQFMDALLSGEYDTRRVALIMFQTGGGCRASNYLSLIRKALEKAGMAYVPVISFSFAGLEKHPGFRLTLPLLHGLAYAVLCGDLLMSLKEQVQPYEIHQGDALALCDAWTEKLGYALGSGAKIRYRRIKALYGEMLADFAAIPRRERNAVRVGVVGEIFVKYSPLANNHLEDFLLGEGAEVTMPGLVDFILYMVYNALVDYRVYHRRAALQPAIRFAWRYLCGKKSDVIRLMRAQGVFQPWTPFEEVPPMAEEFISTAVKMGEGWLLTAEMMELAHAGCRNIVCTQPFGCLPNHICGKGMMKPIKEKYPDVNIVAIDYDASVSRVNQENRLKLMLANAT